MEKIDQVSVLSGREEIDVLRRADGGHRGPASKYYCFSCLEDELYCFQSCNCHKFQMCGPAVGCLTFFLIILQVFPINVLDRKYDEIRI